MDHRLDHTFEYEDRRQATRFDRNAMHVRHAMPSDDFDRLGRRAPMAADVPDVNGIVPTVQVGQFVELGEGFQNGKLGENGQNVGVVTVHDRLSLLSILPGLSVLLSLRCFVRFVPFC